METREALFEYVLRLGDNALILGQRLCELLGWAPELEEEMALANIALDYIGQARMFLSYAGEIEGKGRDEDQLAYTRDILDFRCALMVQQPNGDFAHTMARLFLMSAFNEQLYGWLVRSKDQRLAEIAEKALKEVRYHVRHSGEWVIRLGDGTEESHQRMQRAIDDLWLYTGELFTPDEVDQAMAAEGIGPDLAALKPAWQQKVEAVLREATLERPADGWMPTGGKDGRMHSEHLGHILSELQFLQRAYPGLRW